MTDEQRDGWERLLDLAVYAPLGAAIAARDDLPRFVRQGRQAVQNRVVLARFIGQFAVQQGQREFAKRVDARIAARRDEATVVHVEVAGAADDHVPTDLPDRAEATEAKVADAPAVHDLPITDYESLAASQVVQRLGSLRAEELAAIEAFELAHRARRTVLGKIAQLRAG